MRLLILMMTAGQSSQLALLALDKTVLISTEPGVFDWCGTAFTAHQPQLDMKAASQQPTTYTSLYLKHTCTCHCHLDHLSCCSAFLAGSVRNSWW
jgi:hypothetical protein